MGVSSSWELVKSFDPDTKFIFKNINTFSNILDVSYSIKSDQFIFEI